MTRHIIAIGQLPPPLHGFSHATAGMMALLAEDNEVVAYDVSPPADAGRLTRHVAKAMQVLRAGIGLFRQRGKANKACYLGCEGDWGLLYTLFLVGCSRVSGYPICLHHHSFSYIDKPRALMRYVLAVGGHKLLHIFLCEIMQNRFTDAYPMRISCRIVSNAAFIAPSVESADVEANHLTIGMLSNLNREKGLETFLSLVNEAREAGLAVRAILAGPAPERSDRAAIDEATKKLAGVLEYRGPLYEDAKAQFYRDIDIFVLPTTYANEAQPMVIFEAKAAGNTVISFDRGCIGRQLDTADLLIPANGDFIATSLEWLSELAPGPSFQARKAAICGSYRHRHVAARDSARSLLR